MKTWFFILLVFLCTQLYAGELLIFTAEWCKPCNTFKADYAKDPSIVGPYLETTAVFDVEQSAELAKKYGVKTVPAFLVVEEDTVVRKQEGYNGPANLKKWLENNKRSKR